MITANSVHEILLDCLFREGEDTSSAVLVESILGHTVGFNPERLEQHRNTLIGFIEDISLTFLPDSEGGGGGWSFLKLPFTQSGEQWCEQVTANEFYMLMAALGHARILLPREFWPMLPGGVPYLVFSRKQMTD